MLIMCSSHSWFSDVNVVPCSNPNTRITSQSCHSHNISWKFQMALPNLPTFSGLDVSSQVEGGLDWLYPMLFVLLSFLECWNLVGECNSYVGFPLQLFTTILSSECLSIVSTTLTYNAKTFHWLHSSTQSILIPLWLRSYFQWVAYFEWCTSTLKKYEGTPSLVHCES